MGAPVRSLAPASCIDPVSLIHLYTFTYKKKNSLSLSFFLSFFLWTPGDGVGCSDDSDDEEGSAQPLPLLSTNP